jgi:hypothetical protein
VKKAIEKVQEMKNCEEKEIKRLYKLYKKLEEKEDLLELQRVAGWINTTVTAIIAYKCVIEELGDGEIK